MRLDNLSAELTERLALELLARLEGVDGASGGFAEISGVSRRRGFASSVYLPGGMAFDDGDFLPEAVGYGAGEDSWSGRALFKAASRGESDAARFDEAARGVEARLERGRFAPRGLNGFERRGAAYAGEFGGAAYAAEGLPELVFSGEREPGEGELSERLSERFCRDARRYDGAFERY